MNGTSSTPTRFSITCELQYQVLEPSTVLLNIHALPTPNQQLHAESFRIDDDIRWEEIASGSGEGRLVRFHTGSAANLNLQYNVTAETSHTLADHGQINDSPIMEIPNHVIPYLFPSRYCQSDQLGKIAIKEFGNIPHPYDRVVAISDWIFENIDYLSGSTDAMTSAFDSITQRAGVCRDFAHLGIAFCRAFSIPARYVTAYACNMQPPDFHACFEAYIGGRWFIFDPTRLAPLNGLVKIASGRDAADTSFATIFGNMTPSGMMVSCTSPDFAPFGPGDLDGSAVMLDS